MKTSPRFFYIDTEGQQSGPVDEQQLANWWLADIMNADTAVRRAPSDKWVPLGKIREVTKRVPRWKRSPEKGFSWGVGVGIKFVTAILGVLFLWSFCHHLADPHNWAKDNSKAPRAAIEEWNKKYLADGNAEVMNFSKEFEYQGVPSRVANVRGKNAFGGPIIECRIYSFAGDTVVNSRSYDKEVKALEVISRGAGPSANRSKEDLQVLRSQVH